MPQPIIFYDIACDLNTSPSINVTKTRLTLIHKRIPFETVWVEFADIEKVSKEVGIAPNGKKADGTDRYTLPAIKDQETGHSLADSFKIAQYLDKKYPEHTLVPAGAEAQQAALVDSLSEAVGLDGYSLSWYTLLKHVHGPSKAEIESRIRHLNMDLSTVERMSRQEKQDLLSTVFNRLAGVLDAQNGKGDRVIGDNVTFADVTAAACVQWFLVFTEESEHILTLNGGRWKRLLEIVKA